MYIVKTAVPQKSWQKNISLHIVQNQGVAVGNEQV